MTMLMDDLLTLVQENIPVKRLVFNNGALGFVEMEQRVERVIPPKVEPGQIASTPPFDITAVLNGRVSEVVSLLRNNFLRSGVVGDGP